MYNTRLITFSTYYLVLTWYQVMFCILGDFYQDHFWWLTQMPSWRDNIYRTTKFWAHAKMIVNIWSVMLIGYKIIWRVPLRVRKGLIHCNIISNMIIYTDQMRQRLVTKVVPSICFSENWLLFTRTILMTCTSSIFLFRLGSICD